MIYSKNALTKHITFSGFSVSDPTSFSPFAPIFFTLNPSLRTAASLLPMVLGVISVPMPCPPFSSALRSGSTLSLRSFQAVLWPKQSLQPWSVCIAFYSLLILPASWMASSRPQMPYWLVSRCSGLVCTACLASTLWLIFWQACLSVSMTCSPQHFSPHLTPFFQVDVAPAHAALACPSSTPLNVPPTLRDPWFFYHFPPASWLVHKQCSCFCIECKCLVTPRPVFGWGYLFYTQHNHFSGRCTAGLSLWNQHPHKASD